MNAVLQNPLDYHVQQILDNPNYLTSEQVSKLLAVMPEEKKGSRDKNLNTSLKRQLERQLRMMDKLEALSASSTDIGEMKQVLTAAKDLFNLLTKFQEAIRSEEKITAIEESVVETFNELDNEEARGKFLLKWRERISRLERGA